MADATYDNTVLHDFKTCMRMGYYRHVRNWNVAEKSPALIFGSAWHAAMDVVWRAITEGGDDPTLEAQEAFQAAWIKEGGPAAIPVTHSKRWAPRLPGVGALMIEAYLAKRRNSLKGYYIVECEVPFAVKIMDGVEYVGRRDKLIRDKQGRHIVVDHKTTAMGSAKGGFRPIWKDTWSPKSQIDGYLFSAGAAYPKMNPSAWIDGALVHLTDRLFEFVAVSRATPQLDAWLWETRYWIGLVEQHKRALPQPEPEFMAAFPKNDAACVQFNRTCPYLSVCKTCANPERMTTPPTGMVEKHWKPGGE